MKTLTHISSFHETMSLDIFTIFPLFALGVVLWVISAHKGKVSYKVYKLEQKFMFMLVSSLSAVLIISTNSLAYCWQFGGTKTTWYEAHATEPIFSIHSLFTVSCLYAQRFYFSSVYGSFLEQFWRMFQDFYFLSTFSQDSTYRLLRLWTIIN